MIAKITQKEFTEIVRDGRYRWMASIIFVLLTVSILTGWHHYANVSREHKLAQEAQRNLWLGQGEKNPHSAAHYGIYVFKPCLSLSSADKGMEPYLGVSQFLEAHQQNIAQYRPIKDSTAIQRFGEVTAATTLQVLVPLLIILLGYSTFVGEKEQGTLRQLLSFGVSKNQLAFGKAAGLISTLLLLLIPATIIGIIGMLLNSSTSFEEVSFLRFTGMVISYIAYFSIFVGLTIIVSAKAPSSRVALILLIGFWFVNSFVAVRLVTDIAKSIYPQPSIVEFQKNISDEIRGHGDWQQQVEKKKQELISYYKVTDAKLLPVNPEAIVLDEGEQIDTKVNEKHFNRLYDIYDRQHSVCQLGAIAAPLLAVQSLSMGFAGTDFQQHKHFAKAAEEYRQVFVNKLNKDILAQGNTDKIWEYKANKTLWEKIPAFTYQSPDIVWVLANHKLSITMLVLWLLLIFVITPLAVKTTTID